MSQPILAIVGGFLGAGKTTLLAEAARRLIAKGKRVAIITNDQGEGLVDTAFVRQQGLPAAEVPGGCFCCRFDDLINVARQMTQELKPDFLLAEPVGSCTDLSATVYQPIKRYFADHFRLAALTVLVDPLRFRELLLENDTTAFSAPISYLYLKQLEEADIIAINKVDLISQAFLETLVTYLARQVPKAHVLAISARTGLGLEEWLARVAEDRPAGLNIAEVNYETYAEAEACLAWLNASGELHSEQPFDPSGWLEAFLCNLGERLRAAKSEIAHIKVLVETPAGAIKASVASSQERPSYTLLATSVVRYGKLLINARVNTEPNVLERCVRETFQEVNQQHGIIANFDRMQCFSPPFPEPMYRFRQQATWGG